MKLALLIASLALFRMPAQAAVLYELDPEIRAKTEQLLREKNRDYRHEAAIRLRDKGEHFDRARVEVTGMLSNDDTYRFNTEDFDDQIKPSHSNDQGRSVWSRLRTYGDDKKEMAHAMRGEMSKRAKTTVAPFKNLEINEIVAHSWGTELVYAAILNGDLRPPKKLIVAGVPDDDRAKWEMLAERTGVELYWARADNDAAALDKGVKIAKEAARDVDFKAKWDAACANDAEKRICHPHGRKSKPMIVVPIGRLSGLIAHDRAAYYGVLKSTGVIKNTVGQLRALETKRINLETAKIEKDVLEEAHREAAALVSQAREQKEIARRDREERERLERIEAGQKRFEEDLAEKRRIDAIERQMRDYVREAQRSARTAPTPRNPPSLSAILPKLRDLAISACRFPEQVVISSQEFGYGNDPGPSVDSLAAELVVGLDSCSSRLFIELISKVRARDYAGINRDWVRGKVFEFTPRAPSYYTPPPTGGRCEDYGNVHCPH